MRLALHGACLGWLLASAACSGSSPTLTGVQASDVAAYTAEQQNCLTGSANIAAAQQCVAYVRARWCGYGGSLQQLGACGVDAGPEAGMPLPASVVRILGLTPADAGDGG